MPEESFNANDRRSAVTDHDTITSLVASVNAFHVSTNEKLMEIKNDIKDLRDGIKQQIADHEVRINRLETSKGNQTILISIGIGLLTLLTSLLVYHIMGSAIK